MTARKIEALDALDRPRSTTSADMMGLEEIPVELLDAFCHDIAYSKEHGSQVASDYLTVAVEYSRRMMGD